MPATILDVINSISLFGWGVVAEGVFVVVLSGVIFWQDILKRSNKFFFIFSVTVFLWGTSFVFLNVTAGLFAVYPLLALSYFLGGLIAPTLLFAIDSFSNRDSALSSSRLLLFSAPYVLISLGFFIPGSIVGYADGATDKIIFGDWFVYYAGYSVALVGVCLFLLIKKYRATAGIFRTEVKSFLITFVVTALIALFGTLFLPVLIGSQNFFWVGYTGGAIVFIVATRLLAVKYNFLNFKVIAAESFVSLVVIILIAEIFIARSVLDLAIKTGITFLVVFSSSFLIGSIKREVESKEKIMRLSREIVLISKRLKILDRKKSEFLTIASHHLRDPLTAIKGYSSMLVEGSFGELPAPVREAVEKIFDSSGRLITMISDFMDISRIESGDMKYKFADVDVKKLILEISGEMKQNADRAHLAFSVMIDDHDEENESFITVADAGKLRQVFSNLIDNSIKYTPRGEVSLLLAKSLDGRKIVFSLSDTGIGMNDTTKEKIFKKFSRADGVSKVYTEGTGLGLYVAKEIIKKHEGRIWAESKGESYGSTFYVELEAKR